MIDWKKPGQVVDVGWAGNITSPYYHRACIQFYVDEDGNYFGCDSNQEPKFNPITGKPILSINREFANNDYQE